MFDVSSDWQTCQLGLADFFVMEVSFGLKGPGETL
jgi:hypothetical protein